MSTRSRNASVEGFEQAQLVLVGIGTAKSEIPAAIEKVAVLEASCPKCAGARVLRLCERHHVEGVVQALAALVEPVALRLSRGGGDGRGPVQHTHASASCLLSSVDLKERPWDANAAAIASLLHLWVTLRLEIRRSSYERPSLAGSRPVSRADRSTVPHRHTGERPSSPSGLWKLGPLRSPPIGRPRGFRLEGRLNARGTWQRA